MRVLWVAFAVVVADQLTKIWVRSSMYPHESIPVVGRLFRLTFTENPGMAFGLTLGSKVFLTLFSVVATGLIALYLWHVRRAPTPYRLALALVLGGAFGNIIDRVFYGVVWGYAPLLYGNVVDFIHVDLWQGFVPEAVPFFGGRYFALFPIGNVADLAIIAGVVLILLTQKQAQQALMPAAAPATAPDAEALDGGAPVTDGEPAYDATPLEAPADAAPARPAVPPAPPRD